jgi:hypothetical protein
MKLRDVEKNAVWMGRELHKILDPDKIGVIGGTIKKGRKYQNLADILRPSDKCVLGERSLCNIHRHPQLSSVKVAECDIPYQWGKMILEQNLPEICLGTGLSIANPLVRLLMYNITTDELNTVSLADVKNKPRLPLVNWVERDTAPEDYLTPLEDFRIQGRRPKWTLRTTALAKKCRYFARAKDGFYRELESEETKENFSRYTGAHANGTEWDTDFGLLIVKRNPENPEKKILIAGGNHKLGTWALQCLMNLVKGFPERNTIFERTIDSMAWLAQVIKAESLDEFLAVVRVTDSYLVTGERVIYPYTLGIFSLPP